MRRAAPRRSRPLRGSIARCRPPLRAPPHPGRRAHAGELHDGRADLPRDGRGPRVSFYFTASEEPQRMRRHLPRGAGLRTDRAGRARWMRFDAYVASDFMWQSLPRGTCRIQMFHGVGGKYGFDAPDHLDARLGSHLLRQRAPAAQLRQGRRDRRRTARRSAWSATPKADALVNGTWTRDGVLRSLGLDPSRPTVLYAPTWSPASSLNAMGKELIAAPGERRVNLIVKLHDRSRDVRDALFGRRRLGRRARAAAQGRAAASSRPATTSPRTSSPSDLMITDHSSAGFEFLLRDRPIVRIHRPELIREANIHADYVNLLASVSDSVDARWTTRCGPSSEALAIARRAQRDAARRRRRPLLPSRRRHGARHPRPLRSDRARPAPGWRHRGGDVPLVSVIMPAYNVEPYIGDAIRSALAQTFTDFELIVVDDGSKDGTARSPAYGCAQRRRVRLVQQANRGLAGGPELRAARRARRVLRAARQRRSLGARLSSTSRWRSCARVPRSTSSPATAGAWAARSDGQLARPTPIRARSPTCRRSSATNGRCSSCRSSAAASTRPSAPSTKRCARNEDYDFWLRAAVAGFAFARNDRPLGHYRTATTACRRATCGCCAASCTSTRSSGRSSPGARAKWPSSIARSAASSRTGSRREARLALETADFETAARAPRRAARPPRRRRSGVARLLARWAPTLLTRAYGFRRDATRAGAHLARHEVLGRHRDLQPRRRPARDAREPRRLRPDGAWEVIVVDNNSTDDTRERRRGAAAPFPAPLRYPSSASRDGAPRSTPASGWRRETIIVTTDDDVRVEPDWLDRAAAGLDALGCDYVGGRVLPIWEAPRPAWLPNRGGKHWAVIALLDYGPEPIEFGARVPLGVNMAFRRDAFDARGTARPADGAQGGHAPRAGSPRVVHPRARRRRPRVLHPRDGRSAHHPGVAAQQELLPPLVLLARHQPGDALRAGRARHGGAGRSDARLPERAAAARRAALSLSEGARASHRSRRTMLRGDAVASFDHELWVWFFAGIVRQRWTDRHARPPR